MGDILKDAERYFKFRTYCDSVLNVIRSEKAKLAYKRNSDKHSLEAVGILKQAVDKEDNTSFTKLIAHSLTRLPI